MGKLSEEEKRNDVLRRLKLAALLCSIFLTVEVIGGWLAGSLTVLSDAAHLLADLASFAVAIVASYLATKPATQRHTYGFRRIEALAALFSVSSLAIVSLMLAAEAVRRLWVYYSPFADDTLDQPEVDGKLMSLIASIGVAVNVALAFVLGGEHHHGHSHGHGDGHNHSHQHGHHHGHHAKRTKEKEIAPTFTHVSHDHDHDHGHGHTHHAHCNERRMPNGEIPLISKSQSGHEPAGYSSMVPNGNSEDSNYTPPCAVKVLHADEVLPLESTDASSCAPENDDENLNLTAAYLHVLGDLSMSVAVLIAGLVIWFQPTWGIIDPLCTILFSLIVAYSTVAVFRSSLSVLLEEVPPTVNYETVLKRITAVDGVSNVHDLHIWSISHGAPALSVHATAEDPYSALVEINHICRHQFSIEHATIQLQPTQSKCKNVSKCRGCVTCGEDPSSCCV